VVTATIRINCAFFVSGILAERVVAGVLEEISQVLPSAETSTKYFVTGLPPVFVGALHESVTELLLMAKVCSAGAEATVCGAALIGTEAGPAPTVVTAVTRKK